MIWSEMSYNKYKRPSNPRDELEPDVFDIDFNNKQERWLIKAYAYDDDGMIGKYGDIEEY